MGVASLTFFDFATLPGHTTLSLRHLYHSVCHRPDQRGITLMEEGGTAIIWMTSHSFMKVSTYPDPVNHYLSLLSISSN